MASGKLTVIGAESLSSFLASLARCLASLGTGTSSSGREGAVLPGVDTEGRGLTSSLTLKGNWRVFREEGCPPTG